MFFLIDDIIEFLPNSLILKNCKSSESTKLSAPASRCFIYLLENSPNIVIQKDIMDYVWGSEGMLIPKNTLYQNISIIRRELNKIGYDKKIITTVSRQGFVISNANVKKIDKFENEITPDEVAYITKKNKVEKKCNIIITLFIFFLLVILFSMMYFINDNTNNFYQSYSLYKKYGECTIIYNDANDNILNIIVNEIQPFLSCEMFPIVYVDVKHSLQSNSVLTCKKPFNLYEENDCSSIYVLRKKYIKS